MVTQFTGFFYYGNDNLIFWVLLFQSLKLIIWNDYVKRKKNV